MDGPWFLLALAIFAALWGLFALYDRWRRRGEAGRLTGWVDMHTHPMSHLAFSGKLIHGGPDVGSLLPADSHCRHWVRAESIEHALGPDNPTHGGWSRISLPDNPANRCGDDWRPRVIDALQTENHAVVTQDRARGAPDFVDWPRWDDITHQKMWVDWIRRAHAGGLRVMVALATHNQTLTAAVAGRGDNRYLDDQSSADLQIEETRLFVSRHLDFMELAYSACDVRRIVSAGKLAVVLGVEVDAIGNFHTEAGPTTEQIRAELQRLHAAGVRYIFPVHVIDNAFGGTAVYSGAFNLSNRREHGRFWQLECSADGDEIDYRYAPAGFDVAVEIVKAVKLGMLGVSPGPPPVCPAAPGDGPGHVNQRPLTDLGRFALREMMRLGMMIDIDHMSQKCANDALDLAESIPGSYPLNSGHNRPRATIREPGETKSENSRTDDQLRRIERTGGMFGLGTDAASTKHFAGDYLHVLELIGGGRVALGTDLNGLVKGPRPQPGAVEYDDEFPMSSTLGHTWDYGTDGVAHYGMLPDFLRAVEGTDDGPVIVAALARTAEGFARMWEVCEVQKQNA